MAQARIPKDAIPQPAFEQALESIGYKQEPIETRRDGSIHYRLTNKNRSLPETLTINYPVVAVDGTLWYSRELVFDLFDRLSSTAPDDEFVLRAIKKLDS